MANKKGYNKDREKLKRRIVELKWNQSADTALDQIRRREYPEKLAAYHGNLLLCGINYDREDAEKKHRCRIEKFSV